MNMLMQKFFFSYDNFFPPFLLFFSQKQSSRELGPNCIQAVPAQCRPAMSPMCHNKACLQHSANLYRACAKTVPGGRLVNWGKGGIPGCGRQGQVEVGKKQIWWMWQQFLLSYQHPSQPRRLNMGLLKSAIIQ